MKTYLYRMMYCANFQNPEFKEDCLVELYPILKKPSYDSRDITRILNKHGYPSNKLRKWFKSIPDCLEWIENPANISNDRLKRALDDYVEESIVSPARKTMGNEILFETKAMQDWMKIIKEVRFEDVRGHFYKEYVE